MPQKKINSKILVASPLATPAKIIVDLTRLKKNKNTTEKTSNKLVNILDQMNMSDFSSNLTDRVFHVNSERKKEKSTHITRNETGIRMNTEPSVIGRHHIRTTSFQKNEIEISVCKINLQQRKTQSKSFANKNEFPIKKIIVCILKLFI